MLKKKVESDEELVCRTSYQCSKAEDIKSVRSKYGEI